MSVTSERRNRSYIPSHNLQESLVSYGRSKGFEFLLDTGNRRKTWYFDLARLAHFFLDMPETDRLLLMEASDSRWDDIDPHEVSAAVRRGMETSRRKLKQIGFSLNTNMRFIEALCRGDTATIADLIAHSEEKMKREKNGHGEEVNLPDGYELDFMKEHRPFIDQKMDAIRYRGRPFMWIFTGATGAGKTETFNQAMQDYGGSYYHIDPDATRPRLFPWLDEGNQKHIEKVRPIMWRFHDHELDNAVDAGVPVVMETTLANRKSWLENASIARAKEKGYDIQVIVVEQSFPNSWRRSTFRDKRLVAPSDFWRSTWGYENVVPFSRKWAARVRVHSYLDAFKNQTGIDAEAGKEAQESIRKYRDESGDMVTIHNEAESIPILK